jgi:hypothetical protein
LDKIANFRILKLLPDLSQLAEFALNVVEKIADAARFCSARIWWNVIYEHDALNSTLARMRFQMFESLVETFRKNKALFDAFKFHELKSTNVAEILDRIHPKTDYAAKNEETITLLITSPKLTLQVLKRAELFDDKSVNWIFIDPTFQKELRV